VHFYKRKNFLIILIAPSGGGKSTIGKRVLNECPNVEYSISFTTRKPRGNEVNGKDYFFISEEEFKAKTQESDFLEYAFVHGNWYGTSRQFIKSRLKCGKHILLDIDVHGAKQIIGSGIDAVTIFILPPSVEVLKNRLIERGTDSKEVMEQRLRNARKEIEEAESFQYLVLNDDLQTAVNTVKNIISVEENRTMRYIDIYKTFYGGK
jgi:guanylate kinase